jgi:hypothetical protein
MDQLIREATDIVLHLGNVNVEEMSFSPCEKGSKKYSPGVEQSYPSETLLPYFNN